MNASCQQERTDLREHLANLEYMLIKQALDEAAGVCCPMQPDRLKMRRTTLVEKENAQIWYSTGY